MKFRAQVLAFLCLLGACAFAQEQKFVVIDQDASGPAGTGQQAILVLLQAPQVRVLGITIVTGDGWRDEEIIHTLRMLELMGRSDIPVVSGANLPLIRTAQSTAAWEKSFGKVAYKGAFQNAPPNPNMAIPESNPKTKLAHEDAAHFLVRMVKAHPHQVTIYAGGPLTNLALALKLDPSFASEAKELVMMGASIDPKTNDPEFTRSPHREFNLWFDPEAAHAVLTAKWPSITVTTVDVSIQTKFTPQILQRIAKSSTPAARYIAKYGAQQSDYMWDELAAAAWLKPSLITKQEKLYLDMDLKPGATYGDVMVWTADKKPKQDLPLANVQMSVDVKQFNDYFVALMTSSKADAAKH